MQQILCLLCGIFLVAIMGVKGQLKQPIPPAFFEFDYYLNLEGVQGIPGVEAAELLIRSKPHVTFFQAKKYPPLYFMLRSDTPISQTQFQEWLAASPFTLKYFGEGLPGKEKAIMTGRKYLKP